MQASKTINAKAISLPPKPNPNPILTEKSANTHARLQLACRVPKT